LRGDEHTAETQVPSSTFSWDIHIDHNYCRLYSENEEFDEIIPQHMSQMDHVAELLGSNVHVDHNYHQPYSENEEVYENIDHVAENENTMGMLDMYQLKDSKISLLESKLKARIILKYSFRSY
jgi:hypothetical protein